MSKELPDLAPEAHNQEQDDSQAQAQSLADEAIDRATSVLGEGEETDRTPSPGDDNGGCPKGKKGSGVGRSILGGVIRDAVGDRASTDVGRVGLGADHLLDLALGARGLRDEVDGARVGDRGSAGSGRGGHRAARFLRVHARAGRVEGPRRQGGWRF